ncbi:hypothetical protein ANO11243_095400 [Dothideomycetidae sp. 11243]|nr:hypothetical protein ANO11243_095400 [fungal sp. No.11243]
MDTATGDGKIIQIYNSAGDGSWSLLELATEKVSKGGISGPQLPANKLDIFIIAPEDISVGWQMSLIWSFNAPTVSKALEQQSYLHVSATDKQHLSSTSWNDGETCHLRGLPPFIPHVTLTSLEKDKERHSQNDRPLLLMPGPDAARDDSLLSDLRTNSPSRPASASPLSKEATVKSSQDQHQMGGFVAACLPRFVCLRNELEEFKLVEVEGQTSDERTTEDMLWCELNNPSDEQGDVEDGAWWFVGSSNDTT